MQGDCKTCNYWLPSKEVRHSGKVAMTTTRPTPSEIGALLRRARTAAGLSLEEAGQLIGYSAATLSRWENGHRRGWTITELLRLAEAYGIPPNQLGLATSSPPFTTNPARVSA